MSSQQQALAGIKGVSGGGGGGGGGGLSPNTSLLLHLDTDYTDAAGSTPTSTATAIVTSPVKFGAGAVALTASNSNVTYPSSDKFAYGTGDFTWELWYYTADGTSNKYLLDHGAGNGGTLVCTGTTFRYYNGTVSVVDSATAVSLNTWHHLAVSRKSGTTRMFQNGVLVRTIADSHNYAAGKVTIGNFGGLGYGGYGYIDEVRITKGVALYDATFTPPTAPFTT